MRTTLAHLTHPLVALLAGCGGDSPPTPHSVEDPADRDLGYLDELAELGYVDFADADPSDAEAGLSGVVLHERDAAWSGINLYTSLPDSAAFLMDMEGRVLHSWRDTQGSDTRWTRVELMPDGDVLIVSPKENQLIRKAWDGTERWRIDLDAHHDVRVDHRGRILVLTRKLRRIEAVHPRRFTVDNGIAVLDADGEILAEHSLYDILSGVPELPIEAPKHIERLPPDANVDPLHANTVEPMRHFELATENPIFAPENWLVTLRVTSAIVMIDPKEERVVWWWGTDELEGPHDATVMDNGHILVLDNGWVERGYSRVLEVDPLTREIVWEYTAPEPKDFFTAGRGTVQPLPNGNVLVGNSNSGEAFEVTREGRVVWRFLNPSVDGNGKRAVLRIRRFETSAIEGILKR